MTQIQTSNIETCYAGSARLWGDDLLLTDIEQERHQLQPELESVSDTFLSSIPPREVARLANTSLFHLHAYQHDTSSQSQQQAALSGSILWGLTHPLNAERSVFHYPTPEACADAILSYQPSDAELAARRQQVHQVGLEWWSYAAFIKQFRQIVKER